MTTWLFTNTTYGTWLPGDPRGSVTSVRDFLPEEPTQPTRIEHAQPGSPWETHLPGLHVSAQRKLKGEPIALKCEHAELLVAQFRETCQFRQWRLLAAAVMWNHFHLVIEIGHSRADKALSDLKAYGSRVLNRRFGVPASETWWTSGGSTRSLNDDAAVIAAIRYVLVKQPRPLVVYDGTAPGANASGSGRDSRNAHS